MTSRKWYQDAPIVYFGSSYSVHQNHLPWTIDVSYGSLVFQYAASRPPQDIQQNRVSYVSDNAVVELPFRWSLCYIALTPALQEPERKLIQLNLFQELPVHKTFQKQWSCPTWQWQSDDATGHWLLTVGYVSELGNMTRASLADFWQAACRNFSWTWSILDEASFKTL